MAEKLIPNWSVVAAYASGLHGLVGGLALDLRPVRVNLVSPGPVATEMWAGGGEEELEAMGRGLATGRVGRAEDVAEGYVFLLRDWNVTGSVVRSDGGVMVMG